MANDGYIKLYRKMTQWGWYKDQNTKDVFLHLLLEACYEPCCFRGHRLGIGQVAATVKEISEKTGISVKSVRTSLDKLKSTNELAIETTNKFSIFTLLNYAEYQGTGNQTGKRLANDWQTTGKQLANDSYNKEIKKLRNKEYLSKERKREKLKKGTIPSFDLEDLERRMEESDNVI